MQIRIPAPIAHAFMRVVDFLAVCLLPPPIPIGPKLKWLGRPIDLTDMGVIAWNTVAAIGLWIWTGNWLWVPGMALMLIFAGAIMLPRA